MLSNGHLLGKVLYNDWMLEEMVDSITPILDKHDANLISCHPVLKISFIVGGKPRNFSLVQMAGQCGVMMIYGIPKEYYQKQHNRDICEAIHEISVAVLKYLKYGMLMLSHTDSLTRAYFEDDGWKCVEGFWNPHSENDVYILTYKEDDG